jgi:hypothetical protein
MAHAATEQEDRSASAIEREVDAERQRVSETIDALQRKASVGNIVDQVVKAMGEHGGEVSRNLALTVRDNPMAVLVTGVGLAWLMAGSGPRARGMEEDWEYRGDYARRAGTGGYAPEAGDPLSRFEYPGDESLGDTARSEEGWGEGEVGDGGPGFGERAAGAAGSVAGAAGSMAGSVSGRLGAAAEGVREGAAGAASMASRLAGRAGDAAHRAAGYAPHMGDMRRRMGRTGQRSWRGIESFMDEQPLVAGALALALGAAIGSALPRTRTEDELFGEESDRLKQSLRSTAQEEAHRLARSAQAVTDEAKAIAGEAAEELARSGSSVVDQLEERLDDATERLRQRAADETRNETRNDEGR